MNEGVKLTLPSKSPALFGLKNWLFVTIVALSHTLKYYKKVIKKPVSGKYLLNETSVGPTTISHISFSADWLILHLIPKCKVVLINSKFTLKYIFFLQGGSPNLRNGV